MKKARKIAIINQVIVGIKAEAARMEYHNGMCEHFFKALTRVEMKTVGFRSGFWEIKTVIPMKFWPDHVLKEIEHIDAEVGYWWDSQDIDPRIDWLCAQLKRLSK